MNTLAKLNTIEKKIAGLSKKDEVLWIWICGNDPCSCTEEHKQGNCKKNTSGSCVECKSSSIWVLMMGKSPSGTPIVPKEKLLELVELANKGEVKVPIPMMGGLSTPWNAKRY